MGSGIGTEELSQIRAKGLNIYPPKDFTVIPDNIGDMAPRKGVWCWTELLSFPILEKNSKQGWELSTLILSAPGKINAQSWW